MTITQKDHDDAIAKLQAEHKTAIEKMAADNATALAAVKADLEKAKMSDDEKEHAERLKDEDKKKAYLALPQAERQAVAKAAKVADEQITVGGAVIRKSVVGDAVFTAMKTQQADIEKNAKDLLKAQDDAEMARLEKRADDEFKAVPGTVTIKSQMLKRIMGWPDDLKAAGLSLLKAHNDLVAKGFERMGSNGGGIDISKARGGFMAKVSMIEGRDKVGRVAAMQKARQEFPDEYNAFQNGDQQAA